MKAASFALFAVGILTPVVDRVVQPLDVRGLLLRLLELACCHARLVPETLDVNRTPVHAAELPLTFQQGEVAPDGLGRDVEGGRQSRHFDAGVAPGLLEDAKVPFVGEEAAPIGLRFERHDTKIRKNPHERSNCNMGSFAILRQVNLAAAATEAASVRGNAQESAPAWAACQKLRSS